MIGSPTRCMDLLVMIISHLLGSASDDSDNSSSESETYVKFNRSVCEI